MDLSLARLCEALQASGDPGLSAARLSVQESWGWLRDAVVQGLGVMPPSRREVALGELGQPIAAVLQSAALIGATDLADGTAQFLCQGNDDLTGCLVQVLRAARALAPAGRGAPGIDTIEDHCVRRLTARLAGPDRADDDWSIELPGGCGCELCTSLESFSVTGRDAPSSSLSPKRAGVISTAGLTPPSCPFAIRPGAQAGRTRWC